MGPSCLWLLQQTYRQWRVGPSWQCPAHLLPQIRTEARPWHKIRAPLELGHPIGAYNPMTVHLSPPPPLPRFEILVALAWEKSCIAVQRDKSGRHPYIASVAARTIKYQLGSFAREPVWRPR